VNLFVGVGLLVDEVCGGLDGGLAQLLQVPLPVNQRLEDLQHQQPDNRSLLVLSQ
jgi:hypothetical protein